MAVILPIATLLKAFPELLLFWDNTHCTCHSHMGLQVSHNSAGACEQRAGSQLPGGCLQEQLSTSADTSEVLSPGTAPEELEQLALPPDVHVVDSAEDAQRVAQRLLTKYHDRVLAVDTEVGLCGLGWPGLNLCLRLCMRLAKPPCLKPCTAPHTSTCLKPSCKDLLSRAYQPGGPVFPGHSSDKVPRGSMKRCLLLSCMCHAAHLPVCDQHCALSHVNMILGVLPWTLTCHEHDKFSTLA